MSTRAFIKMQGLGNDFVVLDGRGRKDRLDKTEICALADRRWGVGCDQVIWVIDPSDDLAAATMRIFNPDGEEAEACGNAARCVAAWLMEEASLDHIVIETLCGLIDAHENGDEISVDMGCPRFAWQDIPLAHGADGCHLDVTPLDEGEGGEGGNAEDHDFLRDGCAVSMGNPHVVFFVENAQEIALPVLGPRIEHAPLFPQRVNIEIVQILAPDRLRVRVWERGAGLTQACGSGACAALVAAHRRGLSERRADLLMDGGRLRVEWAKDHHVILTGPVATSFIGQVDMGDLVANRNRGEKEGKL